jgi:hypothetical protein
MVALAPRQESPRRVWPAKMQWFPSVAPSRSTTVWDGWEWFIPPIYRVWKIPCFRWSIVLTHFWVFFSDIGDGSLLGLRRYVCRNSPNPLRNCDGEPCQDSPEKKNGFANGYVQESSSHNNHIDLHGK